MSKLFFKTILLFITLSVGVSLASDFKDAELQGAELQYAELQGANFHQAELQGADLQGAILQGANFHQAELQGAELQYAELQGANLQGAKLRDADLRGIKYDKNTNFTVAIYNRYTSFPKNLNPKEVGMIDSIEAKNTSCSKHFSS